jgi:rhodanese-related sulfurtransferase
MNLISPHDLKAAIHGDREIAVLDVREHGQYGEGHLFYASSCPYSRLEIDVVRLVPNRLARCVLYDDGDGVAGRAAERLAAIGYAHVEVLEGGAAAWSAAGYHLFKGVNLPSKTFGEVTEMRDHPPVISAAELHRWQKDRKNILVFDGRPFSEFRKMSIPGARCVPNGELLYRWDELVADPETTVVINCAGRTRGIIGVQTLRAAGVPNPVYALENGTQGWALSGLELDRGMESAFLPVASENAAWPLPASMGVSTVDTETARKWKNEEARTCYWCDVRTREEFDAGHLAGAVHAPAGQLIQATDQWVAVRRARIVLIDDNGIRARTAGFWLRRMGHDVYVLKSGPDPEDLITGADDSVPLDIPVAHISVAEARQRLASGELVAVDARPSMDFRAAAIPGSRWAIRPRMDRALRGVEGGVVVIAADDAIGRLAAIEVAELAPGPVFILEGGFAAWRTAGLPVEPRPDDPSDQEAIDYLFFVHDRHDGNLEASRRYLAWEQGLLAELDERERGELAGG